MCFTVRLVFLINLCVVFCVLKLCPMFNMRYTVVNIHTQRELSKVEHYGSKIAFCYTVGHKSMIQTEF